MQHGNSTVLCTAAQLNLEKTFECGQCFRWNLNDGIYSGVAFGRAVKMWEEGGEIFITASVDEISQLWRGYFDLDLDYEGIRTGFDAGDYLRMCAEFGAGIRILRQDPWETVCSFIISQCNNIPRIKGIVETLCREFGERSMDETGEAYYCFPTAKTISRLEISDLAPLRCGYRAPYILNAARKISDGELDLEKLTHAGYDKALSELKKLDGVGDKVANCIILFGLHIMSAFPVDVWMKRALIEHFPRDFDPSTLGEYAGLAQQYIFYHSRSKGSVKSKC